MRVPFAIQKIFIFIRSKLFIIDAYDIDVLFRKYFLIPILKNQIFNNVYFEQEILKVHYGFSYITEYA